MERRGHGLFHRHPQDEDAAGAWCPQCGGEFRAGATWCDDCGVPLTASPPLVQPPVVDRHDVVEYDLSDWTDDQVAELESQLAIAYAPHEWTGRHLHVVGIFEAKVDELIDAIDELDDVPDDVRYEFQDWTPQECQQLVDRLLELDVACIWNGYLLSVGEADEATVDAEVLKIDPSFPVTDTEEEAEQPPPSGSGWGRVIAEVVDGLITGPT